MELQPDKKQDVHRVISTDLNESNKKRPCICRGVFYFAFVRACQYITNCINTLNIFASVYTSQVGSIVSRIGITNMAIAYQEDRHRQQQYRSGNGQHTPVCHGLHIQYQITCKGDHRNIKWKPNRQLAGTVIQSNHRQHFKIQKEQQQVSQCDLCRAYHLQCFRPHCKYSRNGYNQQTCILNQR